MFDPFLLMDDFRGDNPSDYIKGFPWHPHRGIETITYLISGDIEHGDSLGNSGSILDGDCQWMTAGSGIIHQEMPKASPRMLGAQLWLNLPAKDKMTDPLYGDIRRDQVPVIRENGSTVRIVAGEYGGRPGAFEGKFVPATYLDVELEPGAEWTFDSDPEWTLFLYSFAGQAAFDPDESVLYDERQAILFERGGEQLWVRAGDKGIRFILVTGQPLREPIAWGGPIVMNTREELDQAFAELDNNTFIRHR
jgi:redox-sensitive bicupin YhaK (pirin superfamily)